MDSQLQEEKQKRPFLASFGEDKNASSESSPRPVRVEKKKKFLQAFLAAVSLN